MDEKKIITFEHGLMGFEDCKNYTIIYDSERPKAICWLQSIEEPALAFPVTNPEHIYKDYKPIVDDEILQTIGELKDENLVILLTVTVPSDIKKVSANLKAPLVINSDTKKAIQIIAENPEYQIKHNIYEAVQTMKKAKGE